MANKLTTLIALIAFACPLLQAQQTGVVVGAAPGSAQRNLPRANVVPPPKPTCDSPATASGNDASSLPDMIFSRDTLVCVRHGDGRTEKLLGDTPWGQQYASNSHIAYWVKEKHQLHVYSIAQHTDTVVDTVPGATPPDMLWSANGHTLAYFVGDANAPGVRVIDLDTNRRNQFAGSVRGFIASPEADYVAVIGSQGVERFRIADGHHEVLIPAKFAERGEYSAKGTLLGILAGTTAKYLNTTPKPVAASTDSEDDGPDCGGGASYLILQAQGSKQLVDVPMPPKFDKVLDFEFSPDERSIAVTFGVASSCDYPGDAARVFRVSLPNLSMTPVSRADQLAAQAHWSPDSKSIIYSDFGELGTPLYAVDVQSGKVTRLTNPSSTSLDSWLAWR